MSKSDIWMPHYIGDYISSTMHLSNEEHGAYLMLRMHYWKNGGPIKNDKILLKNITKLSSKKLENILAFFIEKDGVLCHEKLDVHLKEAAENLEKQKKRTAAATASRWGKTSSEDLRNASVTDIVTSSGTESPLPSPISSLRSDITNNNKTQVQAREKIKLEDLTIDHFSEWIMSRKVSAREIIVDVEEELERFKNHYLSSGGLTTSGQKIVDYESKFKNWIDKAEMNKKQEKRNEKTSGSDQHSTPEERKRYARGKYTPQYSITKEPSAHDNVLAGARAFLDQHGDD